MKKFVVSILMLSMLLMIFPFGISVSAEESFTAEEAMELCQGAEHLWYAIWINTDASDDGRGADLIIDLDDTLNIIDPDPHNYFTFYKLVSIDYKGVSYEADTEDKLRRFIGKFYSNDMIDAFLSVINNGSNNHSECDVFYVDDEKNVYVQIPGYGPFYWYDVIGASNLQIDGNKASVNLILRRRGVPEYEEFLSLPVNYVKTSDGWRLDDVVVDNFLDGKWREYLIENPNTSDPTVPAIAILGTVAVISLALPIVLYRRRRRAA